MNITRTILLTLATIVPVFAGCSNNVTTYVERKSARLFSNELTPIECGTISKIHTCTRVLLASQPSKEDFLQLKNRGVATVINMRHKSESIGFDEYQVVNELGMKYYNPAWNGSDEFTDDIIKQTRALLCDSERPILLHCASANRVGAMWLIYRILDEGIDYGVAIREARTIGMRTKEYEEIALAYIERMSN